MALTLVRVLDQVPVLAPCTHHFFIFHTAINRDRTAICGLVVIFYQFAAFLSLWRYGLDLWRCSLICGGAVSTCGSAEIYCPKNERYSPVNSISGKLHEDPIAYHRGLSTFARKSMFQGLLRANISFILCDGICNHL